MKFGMNLLLWTDHLHDGLMPVLEQLKEIGYDGVEVPIFNADEELYRRLGQTARRSRLSSERPSRFAPRPTTRSRPIAKIRAAGIEATKRTLDCCHALGAESMCGPFHSAIGLFSGAGPTNDEWKWGVDSMRASRRARAEGGRDAGRRIPQPLRDVLPHLRRRHGPVHHRGESSRAAG